MSFLRNLFGLSDRSRLDRQAHSEANAAKPVQESNLKGQASPMALRLHNVVTTMCAQPGRSFSKHAHAAPLYELLPASQITKAVADLFVEATTMTAAFTGARTDESLNALERLCRIQGPVIDNLLHCIAQISDSDHQVDVLDATGPRVVVTSSQSSKVSFEAQRQMARGKLIGAAHQNMIRAAMRRPGRRLCVCVIPCTWPGKNWTGWP